MFKFKKNKVELLKALREIITDEMTNAKLNFDLESETAEFLTHVTDKRRSRRLKGIKKEIDNWLKEMENEKSVA